jgi:hypothetical protein
MVLVEICSVVMGTTSKTTTTWVFPMLAYTTVTCRDVAPVLAGLGESGWHLFDKPIVGQGGQEVDQGLILGCRLYEEVVRNSRLDLKRESK